MSAPFLWIYAFFAGGILVGAHVHAPFWSLCAACLCAIFSLRAERFHLVLAAQALFFFLIGQQMISAQERSYQQNTVRSWVKIHQTESAVVEGVLMRTPEISEDYFVLHLQVYSVSHQPVDGLARIAVSGQMREPLIAGDRLETFVRFRLPTNFRAEGCFDYERYLRKEGIHVLGSTKNPLLIHTTGHEPSFRSLLSRLRLNLIYGIMTRFSARDSAILRALWLDDRTALPQETQQNLIDAGVFHVIAISGFHVAVFLAIGFLLLKRLIPYRAALVVLCLLLLFYFLLLEGRSSITRSFLTFLIFAVAAWRQEQVRWTNVLTLSALVQLCFNPLEVFDPGYHLTYLSTAAIVFVAAPIFKKFRLPRKVYQFAFDFVVTSLTIQFTLTPYQAVVFHKIPLASVLANAVAIPLSSVLIAIAPVVAFTEYLDRAIHFVISAFLSGSTFFSGVWLKVVPRPAATVLILFYGFLCLALICKRPVRRFLCIVPCILSLFVVLHPWTRTHSDFFQIHFIDVGQGDSILLEFPDGSYDLVDGGGFWNEEALDVGESVLLPYLTQLGVQRLHRVFLTHAHSDHMSGLVTLLKYIPADEFYVTRKPLADPGYLHMVTTLNRFPQGICNGREFRQGDVKMKVLAPDDASNTFHVRNDDSLVLLVEYQGKRLLLPGDAEAPTEQKLLLLPNLKADYLKSPHHGSKTSSSSALLDQLRMRAVFISVGANNWFGHPHAEVLSRYRNHHALIYRTDQIGTIRLTMNASGDTIDSFVWSH